MVVVRRLVMELGVEGSLEAIGRLEDVQRAGNNLLDLLRRLDEQARDLFRNLPTGGVGGVLMPPLITMPELGRQERPQRPQITPEERENIDAGRNATLRLIEAIRELNSLIEGASRFERPIDLARRPIFEQVREIQRLFEELGGINLPEGLQAIFNDMQQQAEQITRVVQEQADNSSETISRLERELEELRGESEPVTPTGRQWTRREIERELIRLREEEQAGWEERRQIRERAQEEDPINRIEEELERVRRMGAEETQIDPFIPEEEMGQSRETIQDLEAQLQALQSGEEYELVQVPEVGEEQEQAQEQQNMPEIIARLIGKGGSAEAIQERMDILQQIKDERENAQELERLANIRQEITQRLEREDVLRQRGFVIPLEERAREFGAGIRERISGIGESLKRRAISGLSRLTRGFIQPAEEYFAGEEESLEGQAQEIIEKPENAPIVNNYTVTINNPTITREEQIEELKQQLISALRGL